MSDTQQDIAELRDELNALNEKLQLQIAALRDECYRYAELVMEAHAKVSAVPVPQSLRA